MLSISKCKNILNKNGLHYSDEEVEIIRNVLYIIAETEIGQINRKESTVYNPQKSEDNEKNSNSLQSLSERT